MWSTSNDRLLALKRGRPPVVDDVCGRLVMIVERQALGLLLGKSGRELQLRKKDADVENGALRIRFSSTSLFVIFERARRRL